MGLLRLSKAQVEIVYQEMQKVRAQEGGEEAVAACIETIRPIVCKVIGGKLRLGALEKFLWARDFERAHRIVEREVAKEFKTIAILYFVVAIAGVGFVVSALTV